MISGFEHETEHLSQYEIEMVVPALVNGLKKRIGPRYAIRNKTMCQFLRERGFERISEVRVRKCINYIRRNGMVPHLVANSRGYYVAESVADVERYAQSLKERATAILEMRSALVKQLEGKLFL